MKNLCDQKIKLVLISSLVSWKYFLRWQETFSVFFPVFSFANKFLGQSKDVQSYLFNLQVDDLRPVFIKFSKIILKDDLFDVFMIINKIRKSHRNDLFHKIIFTFLKLLFWLTTNFSSTDEKNDCVTIRHGPRPFVFYSWY